MSELEHFQEVLSLRQSLSAMATTAAEWIEQHAAEKAALKMRIEELEGACKALLEWNATDFDTYSPELDRVVELTRKVMDPKRGEKR
jgi:hypothetical protein